MKREALETIYQDGNLLLGKYEGQYYLFKGEQPPSGIQIDAGTLMM